MDNRMTIIDVSGPFREPREAVFSYDYSLQRKIWPTPHAARVKVSIADELDVLKTKILGALTGSPGQQLMISQILSRRIADEKLRIADAEGQLMEQREVIVPPFVESLSHLFPRLESWAEQQRETLSAEIKKWVKL